jgi:gamma-glutamylcyclotransferase (GGCT)/AIG2-like uncharacterized protein YtfP
MIAIFGYGSLLDMSTFRKCDRIKRPITKHTEIAKLHGYKLHFNKISKTKKYAFANVEKSTKNSEVYGLIIYLTKDELKTIDSREGHPFHYKRTKIEVETLKGFRKVYTYIATPEWCAENDQKISQDYYKAMMNGINYISSRDKKKKLFKNEKYFHELKQRLSQLLI